MADPAALLRYLQAHARGKANAKRRADVASWLRITIREVKHLAEELRLNGELVGWSTDSLEGGLYIAVTHAEAHEILGKMRRMAMTMLREYGAVKRAVYRQQEADSQRELF